MRCLLCGDGSILEAQFIAGLTNEQVITLFQRARKSDYEKIIQDANHLLVEWSSELSDPKSPAVKGPAQVSRLQRRLDDVAAIDFFEVSQQGIAKNLIKELTARLSGHSLSMTAVKDGIENLKGKIWVTRKNIFVDRIACAWLIRRFVDTAAVFKFIDKKIYTANPGELCFDMFEGEYTHKGDCCTFEVMIQRFRLQDRALTCLAEVVHDIDLKDNQYDHAVTDGFNALLTGLAAAQPADDQRMIDGFQLFENLYAYFKTMDSE
ncbi:MAG: ChrB protein [Deltaproteobacteria bacterium]|nr:MAG: ChrB protein [Deltaproteobacteria bacterium]